MLSQINKLCYNFNRQARAFSTLVIGEHKAGKVSPVTLSAMTAALQLKKPIDILFAGQNANDLKETAMTQLGSELSQNLVLMDHDFKTADVYCNFLNKYITSKNYTHIVAPNTNYTKDYLPRLSGALGKQAIPDVIEVLSENEFRRPIYAGNAIAKVRSNATMKILSVRPTNFDPYQSQGNPISNVEELSTDYLSDIQGNRSAEFVSENIVKSERPDLGDAKIVVSGGRALKSSDNFDILYKLADVLGNTAVGASRAAVDAGYCSNDMQVGQTGKVVAPELYVAIGISGAIQHLAGMKDSKVIVCINKDAEAPIFGVSNYGLVGDLFKIVPELTEKLEKLRAN